jgi:hypothetical protein
MRAKLLINDDVLDTLLEDACFGLALREGGVDNWTGYKGCQKVYEDSISGFKEDLKKAYVTKARECDV